MRDKENSRADGWASDEPTLYPECEIRAPANVKNIVSHIYSAVPAPVMHELGEDKVGVVDVEKQHVADVKLLVSGGEVQQRPIARLEPDLVPNIVHCKLLRIPLMQHNGLRREKRVRKYPHQSDS